MVHSSNPVYLSTPTLYLRLFVVLRIYDLTAQSSEIFAKDFQEEISINTILCLSKVVSFGMTLEEFLEFLNVSLSTSIPIYRFEIQKEI